MQETTPGENSRAPVPSTLGGYLRAMGPGLVVALAWLGTGDLIDSAVSGASYGYALMWAFVIALLCRFFVTSALAKYVLCNSQGDKTILDGYARAWRGFPLLLGVIGVIMGFIYISYVLLGAGVALYNLFGRVGGEWGIFAWSLVVVALSLFVSTRSRQYRTLEIVATVTVIALVVAFFTAIAGSGIDIGGFLAGLTFDIPPDEGPFGATLVAVSIIGAIGGSITNLLYPYFISEKGWDTPAHRKLQIFDLLTGIVSIIVISLSVWIVSAEVLRGTGRNIGTENDLAYMMELAIGPFGPTLLWIALFFVTFDNIAVYAFGFTRMLTSAVHRSFPQRTERYGNDVSDPLFRWIQLGLLTVLPVVAALPFFPNLIVLTIVGNSFTVLFVPIVIGGLIWITSSKRLMLPGYANSWWEILILLIIGGIGLWATYGLIAGFADLISGFTG